MGFVMPNRHPLAGFTVNHFTFCCEALDPIQFEAQPGTAVRGALYHALIRRFSPTPPAPGEPLDPVRALLAGEDEAAARGRDLPRAFGIEPPQADRFVRRGERFNFGISLYGRADALIPYLFQALPEMGAQGIGRGRGRFRLVRIQEIDPFDSSSRTLASADRADAPRLTITHQRVREEVNARRPGVVTLDFVTPMRLIDRSALLRTPQMGTLLRRLIERAQSLYEQYAPDSADSSPSRDTWRSEWERMGQLGDALDADARCGETVRWVDVQSYSRTRGRATPIGGFVGQASWLVDSAEVLAWLLWGQSLHVGKNAAKGDGFFLIS